MVAAGKSRPLVASVKLAPDYARLAIHDSPFVTRDREIRRNSRFNTYPPRAIDDHGSLFI